MNTHAVIVLIIGLAILTLLFLIITAFRRKREKSIPDFRVMFIIGISFIPIGITTDNTMFWIMGIVLMAIGLTNRKQWGQQTKWSDRSLNAKKIKLLQVGGLSVLILLGVAVILFFDVR